MDALSVMKQALEALEDCYSTGGDNGQPLYQFYDDGLVNAAITALRAALEQAAVAEPHKWVHATTWRGLTDEERIQSWFDTKMSAYEYIREIEAKLRERNGGQA